MTAPRNKLPSPVSPRLDRAIGGRRPTLAAMLLAVAALLTLVACGASETPEPADSTPAPATDAQGAAAPATDTDPTIHERDFEDGTPDGTAAATDGAPSEPITSNDFEDGQAEPAEDGAPADG